MGKKVAMVSLGCAKNQVDAEQMLCLLHEAGYEVTTEVEYSDVTIVNTCGFIESAKSEAIQDGRAAGGGWNLGLRQLWGDRLRRG